MFAVPENTVNVPVESDYAAVHPVRLAREFAANRASWAHLLRYDPDERWATLISRGDWYEAWLLSWLPEQHTEPHDHGGATGAFTVVNGTVTERVLRAGAEAVHVLSAGQSRVFGPNYVHQVYNAGADPAVTIHVYRPGRAQQPVYSWGATSEVANDTPSG